MEIAQTCKSEKWEMIDLIKVIKSLKSGKSRDPHGLIRELFKPEVCGVDFQRSFLSMANKIKDEIFFPKFMHYANIVSIYKGKGEKLDLDNDRGIFIVNLFRSIILKMVYHDKYETVDKNMSDSNVGARRKKNIRNHLFVLNGIINDVLVKKDESVDIQILDYRQCFDSMWLEESINDLWDAGITDDKLALIAKANETVNVGVKTPFGETERRRLENIVMQGDIFGPLCCSVQVDTFGKECLESKKHLYYYKEVVGVPPLAMVDDLLCISKCGMESVQMNGFINAKSNLKKLQFGVSKCHKMHVGKKSIVCPDLYVDKWELKKTDTFDNEEENFVDEEKGDEKLDTTENEKYLGDIISSDGRNKKNVMARRSKGVGIVKQVMEILDGTCYGPFIFEVGQILRNSLLVNGILTNSESWYGIKDEEIDHLEQVDEMLLRKFLEVGAGCPKEMLYLETGSWPLRYVIMSRRLMFLHYLLNEDESSLVFMFLQAQIKNPVKNDWIHSVYENLEELGIGLALETISTLSTARFKKFLDVQIKARVLEYLNEVKAKHSKVMHIKHDELKIQKYLLSENQVNVQQSKFIFHARSRMLNVRTNFKNKYPKDRRNCPLGCKMEDSQEHLLSCEKISDKLGLSSVSTLTQPQYDDLFSEDNMKQNQIAAILNERIKVREKMLE